MMISCSKHFQILQADGGIDPEPNETLFLLSDDDLLPMIDMCPLSKLMDKSTTERENVSTLQWWSVAANRFESFKQIDGEFENLKRKCLYFALMICCRWSMCVLYANWWRGGEPKEKLLLLCDDDLLLQTDVRPSNKLMERSRTEGETVSTLQWWTVAADLFASFKEVDGQIGNRTRHCLYFAMMNCCCYRTRVLQGNGWTGLEPKKNMFLLCNEDLLLLPEQSASKKLMDKSRTQGETLQWWSVAVLMDLRPSRIFKQRSKTEGATESTLGWWSYIMAVRTFLNFLMEIACSLNVLFVLNFTLYLFTYLN